MIHFVSSAVVFALACMADVNRPPYNNDANRYYQLARVAMGLDSIIDHPSVQAIRTVVSHLELSNVNVAPLRRTIQLLMTIFLQMCDHPRGATICYSLLGLNAQLCKGVSRILRGGPNLLTSQSQLGLRSRHPIPVASEC